MPRAASVPTRLPRLLAAGAALTLAAAAAPSAAAAPAPEQLPVPYTFLSGAAQEITRPGSPLAGADDWSCRPSAEHPRPVVLVHGTFGGGTDNWATYGPLLHNHGYCVYTLTYGAIEGAAWPLGAVGGLQSVPDVAIPQVSAFVDRVLAATGAGQVDLVGHSQGTVVSGAVAKLSRPGKVASVVSLAALWHGTGGSLTAQLLGARPEVRQAIGTSLVPSIGDMLPDSGVLRQLWAGGTPYAAGVRYTNIATRYDEAVLPYTSGLVPGPGVQNRVVQDGCEVDIAEHAALASDPRAADYVLAALDPAAPAPAPRCVPVAPVHAAVGAVPPAAG